MPTTYTQRTRPTPSVYSTRARLTKRKDYLRGIFSDLSTVDILDEDDNRIVIYWDSGFEEITMVTRTTRDRI